MGGLVGRLSKDGVHTHTRTHTRVPLLVVAALWFLTSQLVIQINKTGN